MNSRPILTAAVLLILSVAFWAAAALAFVFVSRSLIPVVG